MLLENIYSPDNIIDIGHAGYEQGMQVAKKSDNIILLGLSSQF